MFKLCSFGCRSSGDVPLHPFPDPGKFPDHFKKWVGFIRGKLEKSSDYEYYKKKCLCDLHFTDQDRNKRNKRLMARAIPSLRPVLPIDEMDKKSTSPVKIVRKKKKATPRPFRADLPEIAEEDIYSHSSLHNLKMFDTLAKNPESESLRESNTPKTISNSTGKVATDSPSTSISHNNKTGLQPTQTAHMSNATGVPSSSDSQKHKPEFVPSQMGYDCYAEVPSAKNSHLYKMLPEDKRPKYKKMSFGCQTCRMRAEHGYSKDILKCVRKHRNAEVPSAKNSHLYKMLPEDKRPKYKKMSFGCQTCRMRAEHGYSKDILKCVRKHRRLYGKQYAKATATILHLAEQLEHTKQQFRSSQAHVQVLKARNKFFRQKLVTLRKNHQQNILEKVTKDMTPAARVFTLMQFTQTCKSIRNRKFTHDEIDLSIAMYKSNPLGYELLCKFFKLPSVLYIRRSLVAIEKEIDEEIKLDQIEEFEPDYENEILVRSQMQSINGDFFSSVPGVGSSVNIDFQLNNSVIEEYSYQTKLIMESAGLNDDMTEL